MILCQITSQTRSDLDAIPLHLSDFESGGLNQPSRIRHNRLFTADSNIVVYRAGHVHDTKLDEAISRLIGILKP